MFVCARLLTASLVGAVLSSVLKRPAILLSRRSPHGIAFCSRSAIPMADELTEVKREILALKFCLAGRDDVVPGDEIKDLVEMYGFKGKKRFLETQLTLVREKELLLMRRIDGSTTPEIHEEDQSEAKENPGVVIISKRRPLKSLTIKEVVVLMKSLQFPGDCEAVIRKARINGKKLYEISSCDDIREFALALTPAREQALLEFLEDYRQNGVDPQLLILGLEVVPAAPDSSSSTAAGGGGIDGAEKFSIAPDTDLTTVKGISTALSHLVTFLEDGTIRTESLFSVAARVLDAIPAFIGSDGGSADKMISLGAASDSRVIENLMNLLNHLLARASSGSKASKTAAVSSTMLKTLKAINVIMVAEHCNPKRTIAPDTCGVPIDIRAGVDVNNINAFGNLGICKLVPEILEKWLELHREEAEAAARAAAATASDAREEGGERKTGDDAAASAADAREEGEAAARAAATAAADAREEGGERKTGDAITPAPPPAAAAVLAECCRTAKHIGTGRLFVQCTAVLDSFDMLADVLKQLGTSDAAVAEQCCGAIGQIAENDDNRDKFGALPGAIASIVNVLEAHGTRDVAVALACFEAITGLAPMNTANGDRFASAGVVPAIVSFLKAFGRNDSILSKNALNECFEAILYLGNQPNSLRQLKLHEVARVLLKDVPVFDSDFRLKVYATMAAAGLG